MKIKDKFLQDIDLNNLKLNLQINTLIYTGSLRELNYLKI